tara:strand:+ start:1311 stop:1898 length:588 start_codon:yes stop_codon:yes gene_type:complete
MDTKRGLQLSLVILLILSSVFFYQKFFNVKVDVTEKKIKKENPDNKKEIEKSNLIESLRYISQDLIGNTYIINADSAKFVENKVDNIFLFNVNAEIIRKDNEAIKIYSDSANYNKKNNDTVFKKNVIIEYTDQIVKAEIVKLNFSKNLIEIIENVYFMNNDTKIYADKVELDYLKKKMRISMIDQNDNVQIFRKY